MSATMIRVLVIIITVISIHNYQLFAQQNPCASLPWEARVVADANSVASLKGLSHFASDGLYPIAGVLPLSLYAAGFIGHDRYVAETGLMLAALEATTFLTLVVTKQLINRDRPYIQYPGCIIGGEDDKMKSMPSGHAAITTAITTFLSLRYPYWYVYTPLSMYTSYTLFARMNLGMHYPSDLIVGALIGAGFAILGNAILPKVSPSLHSILPERLSIIPTPLNIRLFTFTYNLQ